MALIQCPECGKDVSDAAVACPHCGHPINQPGPAAQPAPAKKTSSRAGRTGCLVVIAIIGGLMLIGAIGGSNDSKTAGSASNNGCSSDWHRCVDNADLVNNFSGWTGVQVACKLEANQRARYGTPEWPWLPFGTFLKGTKYITTGKAVAIEPDAQFQNGFGAMVHSEVMCTYDLNAQRVDDVLIIAK